MQKLGLTIVTEKVQMKFSTANAEEKKTLETQMKECFKTFCSVFTVTYVAQTFTYLFYKLNDG